MERLLTFNVYISNGNIKYPIGKSIVALKLPLNLFRAIVAKLTLEVFSLSIHSLKMFVPHASEILSKLNEIWSFLNKKQTNKKTKFELFWQKICFL